MIKEPIIKTVNKIFLGFLQKLPNFSFCGILNINMIQQNKINSKPKPIRLVTKTFILLSLFSEKIFTHPNKKVIAAVKAPTISIFFLFKEDISSFKTSISFFSLKNSISFFSN